MKQLTTQAAQWAAKITKTWRASVEAIITCGQLLIDAKKKLPHGTFGRMVKNDLPFGERTAQQLMTIARDERLRDANHGSLLPASWRTLYDITRLSNATFGRGIEERIIRADMERSDLEALLPAPTPPEWRLIRASVSEHTVRIAVPYTASERTERIVAPVYVHEVQKISSRP